jgi:hypothetical protein
VTGKPADLYLSESAIQQAFAKAERCPDCVTVDGGERVLSVSPSRGEWGVHVRHASTCPRLTPREHALAAAWWRGLREKEAADEEQSRDHE